MSKPYPVTHSDAEWRQLLTPEQYYIMREHPATEMPGSCALLVGEAAREFTLRRLRRPTLFEYACRKFEMRHRLAELSTSRSPGCVETVGRRQPQAWLLGREVHCATCGSHLGTRQYIDYSPPPIRISAIASTASR